MRERVRHTRKHGPAANVDSALERWFTPAFRAGKPGLIALIRTWITSNDPAVFSRIYRVLAEGDAEIVRGLERIACPTLVMTGEADPGNTPAMSEAMAGLIPGARLESCRASGTWRSPNLRTRSTSRCARFCAARSRWLDGNRTAHRTFR